MKAFEISEEGAAMTLTAPNPDVTDVPSLLRCLREKKGLSREEFSKRARMTRGQLQHVEQKELDELKIKEIRQFAKGIGYRAVDLARLIHAGEEKSADIFKHSIDKPVYKTQFKEGAELIGLSEKGRRNFVGILNLEPGRKIQRDYLPPSDLLFGTVLKGQLRLEGAHAAQLCEERSCFEVRSGKPVEFHNASLVHRLSILIFSVISTDL